MKIGGILKLFASIAIIGLSSALTMADQATNGKVTIQFEPTADGGAKVINVWNRGDKRIELKIDGKTYTVNGNSSAQLHQYAAKYVRYDYSTSTGALLWKATPISQKDTKAIDSKAEETAAQPKETEKGPSKSVAISKSRDVEETIARKEEAMPTKAPMGCFEKLNKDSFYGVDAVTAYVQKTEKFCKGLETSSNKEQYIVDNDLQSFLADSEAEILVKKANLASTAQNMVKSPDIDAANQASTLNLIVETLTNRLATRENAFNKLKTQVDRISEVQNDAETEGTENILNFVLIGAILLFIILLIVVATKRKGVKKGNIQNGGPKDNKNAVETTPGAVESADIVVRRRTTTMLKRLSLEDVIGNPSYLVIKTADFTPDSAVRNIYIKNTCIKDVYNLYADDLRNTENPKEDGCMVLGRWVYDEADHTYDVSLEEVVFPGDDAVFKEYELNFGGKIKLRIAEKLRKLRRETNLQYDLVCWIHSHPGLGVFFSNSDDNVQMQLKHPQHPNFLIAFVVDILTSNQEMGIFTFRRDGSMNSKGDLLKMHSLEEMYKWSLQSESGLFAPGNYFNLIENANLKLPSCKGVEMNNSSIIDLTQIVIKPDTGIVGWAIGTKIENGDNKEYAVSNIVEGSSRPGTGVIGCLVSLAHMSYPSIQKLIARDRSNISFVMVYSSKQQTVTTIPVINGELLSDEHFYGDVTIDDLKIWTRRRR